MDCGTVCQLPDVKQETDPDCVSQGKLEQEDIKTEECDIKDEIHPTYDLPPVINVKSEGLKAPIKKNFATVTPGVIVSPQVSVISGTMSQQCERSNLNLSTNHLPDTQDYSTPSTSLTGNDLQDFVSGQTGEFTEGTESLELTTSAPCSIMESYKTTEEENVKNFFEKTELAVGSSFMNNFSTACKRRKEAESAYHQELENECETLEKKIEHCNEDDERRLKKSDKYLRHISSLNQNYADKFTRSKSKLHKTQQHYKNDRKKAKREERKLSAKTNEDLKQKLDNLITETINKSTSNFENMILKLKEIFGLREEED